MRIPYCWICMDDGVVLYRKEAGEYVAHCICDAGREFEYKGKDYYVPSVEEILDPDEHARNNIKNWLDAHENNSEAKKELEQRGIKITMASKNI